MLNERQNNIVESLLFEGHMNVTEISKHYNVSRKTIYDDISVIGSWLREAGLGTIKKTEKGNYLIEGNNKKIISALFAASEKFSAYSVKERHALILFKIVQNPMITIETISEDLDVSKSTIAKDVQEIREKLQESDVDLIYGNKSYFFSGEEYNLRSTLINYLSPYAYKLVNTGILTNQKLFSIEEKLKNFSLLAVDIAKLSFFIQEKRIDSGFLVDKPIKNRGYYCIELEEMDRIFREDFSEYTLLEREYSYVLLKGFFRFRANQEAYTNPLCIQILNQLLLAFKTILSMDFKHKETFSLLYSHFEPSVYRLALGIVLVNPIFEDIAEKHAKAYQLARLSLSQSVGENSKFIDHEASYLAILLLSQKINQEGQGEKILIACYEGTTMSHSIKQQMAHMHLNIENIICTSFDNLNKYGKCLIITTVMPKTVPKGSECVVVNPILTEADKIKIMRALNMEGLIRADIVQILKIVKKHVDEETYQNIVGQILIKESKAIAVADKKGEIMLKDLITEDSIQFCNEKIDWREAVQKAGAPLIKNHAITEIYVKEVIENIEKNGAYIVLKEGFALPHARTSEAVHRVSMSLMVTKERVYFSDEEKQWANVIVMLAATDPNSHLNALSELVSLISDEEKFKQIQNASSKEEVIKIIEEVSV